MLICGRRFISWKTADIRLRLYSGRVYKRRRKTVLSTEYKLHYQKYPWPVSLNPTVLHLPSHRYLQSPMEQMTGYMKQCFYRIRLKNNSNHLYPACRHHIRETDRLSGNKGLGLQLRLAQQKKLFPFMEYQLHAANRQSPFGDRSYWVVLQYPVMPYIGSQCKTGFYQLKWLHITKILFLNPNAKVKLLFKRG